MLVFNELCKAFCSRLHDTPHLAELFVAELVSASKRHVLAALLVEREREVVDGMLLPMLLNLKADQLHVAGRDSHSRAYDAAAVEELLSIIDRSIGMRVNGLLYTRSLSGLFYCSLLLWCWRRSKGRSSAAGEVQVALQTALAFIRAGRADLAFPHSSQDVSFVGSIPGLPVYLLFVEDEFRRITGQRGASVVHAAEQMLTALVMGDDIHLTKVSSSSSSSSAAPLLRLPHLTITRTLVWELGAAQAAAAPECLAAAVCALTRFCQILVARTSREGDNAPPQEQLATLLSRQMFSIMSNLLLRDWDNQSQEYQVRSLRCFRVLITLVSQSDLVKFLSKVPPPI